LGLINENPDSDVNLDVFDLDAPLEHIENNTVESKSNEQNEISDYQNINESLDELNEIRGETNDLEIDES
jgi:hypothetical protein